jgi:hypothetical protein
MIPTNLKYGSKVESSIARSYRTNIQPQSGNLFNGGDTITINIPTRANLVLVPTESYLKFKLTATNNNGAGNSFRLDRCGAHGVIQRLRVWSGSNLLQDIDSYAMLAAIMMDAYVPTDKVYGAFNATQGTRNDLVTVTPAAAALAGVSCFQSNSGDLIGTGSYVFGAVGAVNPASIGAGASVSDTYCLNLISLLGSLCKDNYFPLFACTSAPIRLELQLVSGIQNLCASQISTLANTFNLQNVEYVGQFIDLGDEAMSMIYSSLGSEPLQMVVPDYRNYQGSYQLSIGATPINTLVNFPIPAKFSSLKSLICTVRDRAPASTATNTFFPFSSVSLGIQNYQYRLGSTVAPSKMPDTIPEMFEEMTKAVSSLADLNHQPSIEKFSYQLANSVAYNSIAAQGLGSSTTFTVTIDGVGTVSNCNSGSFYAGIDLENYSAASKTSIFSGYNSNTDDIFWQPTFAPIANANAVSGIGAAGSTLTVRLDAFANYDCVVVFQDNTAYTKI